MISSLFTPLRSFTPLVYVPISNNTFYYLQLELTGERLEQLISSFLLDIKNVYENNSQFNKNYVILSFFFFCLVHTNKELKQKLFKNYFSKNNSSNIIEYLISSGLKTFYHENIFEFITSSIKYLSLTYKLKTIYTPSFLNTVILTTSLTSNLLSDLICNFFYEYKLLTEKRAKQMNSFYGFYGVNSVLFYYYSKLFKINLSSCFNLTCPSLNGLKCSLIEPPSLQEQFNKSSNINDLNVKKIDKSQSPFTYFFYYFQYFQYLVIRSIDYNNYIFLLNSLQLIVNDFASYATNSSLESLQIVSLLSTLYLPYSFTSFFSFFAFNNISNEIGGIFNVYLLDNFILDSIKIQKFIDKKQTILDFFTNMFNI